MRHLDLFSGIGGFALAVRWLGHETVGFCEIDPWCRKVLDKHWPEVPKHDDIRTLNGNQFGPIDIITGGFPCQPFSVAGERRGEDDPRHLWPAMLRVIDEARPRFVLGENVAGIINMALDGVLADLEAIGYTARAVVIPAGAVNALHRRDRVWIMAHSPSAGQPPLDSERSQPEGSREAGATHTRSGNAAPAVADTRHTEPSGRILPSQGQQPRQRREARREPASCGMGNTDEPGLEGRKLGGQRARERAAGQAGCEPAVRTEPEVARSLDAGPDGLPPELVRRSWADGTWELDLPRVVTHEPERKQKLQAAGNAIVPQVAYEILKVMIGDNSH